MTMDDTRILVNVLQQYYPYRYKEESTEQDVTIWYSVLHDTALDDALARLREHIHNDMAGYPPVYAALRSASNTNASPVTMHLDDATGDVVWSARSGSDKPARIAVTQVDTDEYMDADGRIYAFPHA